MTRRIIALSVFAVLTCALSTSAQTVVVGPAASDRSSAERPAVNVPSVRASSNAAAQLLRKRVDNIGWDNKMLEDVIAWLDAEGEDQVNIIPRWGALSVQSVDPDTPVTLQLNNTTIAEVLNEILDQLSEDGALRYRAIGSTLKISTQADFDRRLYTRIYDVTDILFDVPNFGQQAPNIDLQNTTSGGGGGGGGGGQSVFQGGSGSSGRQSGGEQAENEMEEKLEELRLVIEQIVAPDTWDSATGGTAGRGRIRVFNRSLIVTNTIEVHEQIAGHFSFGG